MEQKDLYEKAEKAINQAFEVTKQSVKVISEKAGEAAHITRLLLEKASLEHRVSKKFAEIGGWVYQHSLREGQEISVKDPAVKGLVEDARKLDLSLSQVEATIEEERRQKKTRRSRGAKGSED